MKRDKHQDAVDQLAKYLSLSEEAIHVAEGWSILPLSVQRHFKLLIDDYVAHLHPILRDLYANARERDQLRFNRIAERVQAERHPRPSSDNA